jgi:hypothetical protein
MKIGCAFDDAACVNTMRTLVKNIDRTSNLIELMTLYERKFLPIPMDFSEIALNMKLSHLYRSCMRPYILLYRAILSEESLN